MSKAPLNRLLTRYRRNRKLQHSVPSCIPQREESSLIFGRTKYGVEKLGKQLSKLGFTVGTLHGNKSQRAREEVLTAFRHGHVQTLLATNVAARGLDITGIYQVINYELPEIQRSFYAPHWPHGQNGATRQGDHTACAIGFTQMATYGMQFRAYSRTAAARDYRRSH